MADTSQISATVKNTSIDDINKIVQGNPLLSFSKAVDILLEEALKAREKKKK